MKELSPRELARSLGVSESSVKRWVDDGTLTARRTAGGHRRIAVAEAVRFVRQSGETVVRPELILGLGKIPATAPFSPAAGNETGQQLLHLLRTDEASAARAMLVSLYVSGWPIAAICDGPIRVALGEIGTLWRHGADGIVVEHRATDTCIRALAEIRALLPSPVTDAPTAVGAAPSGDPYILPSMMAAAVLADLGYRDRNLGPNVPPTALVQAVTQYRPRIVWLAMSLVRDDERPTTAESDLARRVAQMGATLIVGGRGAPPVAPVPGVLLMHSMAELAAFARGAAAAKP